MFLRGVAPFALSPEEKASFLVPQLRSLVDYHRERCARYGHWLSQADDRWRTATDVADLPYLPVTVFKEFDLRSTAGEVLSVNSSATTGAASSRIAVDRDTRKRQNLSATKLLTDFIGAEQRPYLVFDREETVRGASSMSARGAAILSLAHLASEFHFVMREDDGDLVVDRERLDAALSAIGDRPFVAYGFTYLLYFAHQALAEAGARFAAHPASTFLHSGGWKRLQALAVDKASFNASIAGVWGLAPTRIVDFYGLVEQVGVLYPDCPEGFKHVPYWADVLIRRADDLTPAAVGETGLMQLLNCLPLSAPNHSILTEDLGMLVHADRCPCGRRGRAFVFMGRAPKADMRGCSDVVRR
ncbi:MAG: hypothetical protein U0Q12_13350 [Vicinamibacterales bacterium]